MGKVSKNCLSSEDEDLETFFVPAIPAAVIFDKKKSNGKCREAHEMTTVTKMWPWELTEARRREILTQLKPYPTTLQGGEKS